MKIVSVRITIPAAVTVCQSMRLESKELSGLKYEQ